jgi:hypothetical protein
MQRIQGRQDREKWSLDKLCKTLRIEAKARKRMRARLTRPFSLKWIIVRVVRIVKMGRFAVMLSRSLMRSYCNASLRSKVV